jgi:probable HAF family extracellular repeat protein
LGKDLEKLGIQSSVGTGINANGQVVGSGLLYQNGRDIGPRSHLWTAGNAKNLGTFFTDSNGYSDIRVTGINNAGHILGLVVSSELPGLFRGFLWANNSFQKLVDLGVALDDTNYSIGDAFNNKDEVAGRSGSLGGVDSAMVLWKNGVIQKLGMLSTAQGFNPPFPIAINDKSQITGWEQFDAGGSHAFLWSNGNLTDLGGLGVDESGYISTYPTALNNNGQVVGNSSYSEGGVAKGFHAFIYQNKILTDLNTLLPLGSGWVLENALAINDKGQITVYGTYAQGVESYKGYALLSPQ